MPYLQINPSKTYVNYDDWFTYTLEMSFGDLIGPLHPVMVEIIVPSFIDYLPLSLIDPIHAIHYTPIEEGTKITIDFDLLTGTNLAITLLLTCRYQLNTPTTSFVLRCMMYIHTLSTPVYTYLSPPVTLVLKPLYTLTLTLYDSPDTHLIPGGSAVYQVILENIGDQWKDVYEISMTFDLNKTAYLALDNHYPITGKDISTSRYQDHSADGIEATSLSTGNGFTFTLPHYKGQTYTFFFKSFISAAATVGSTTTLTIPWTIDGHPMPSPSYSFKVTLPTSTPLSLMSTHTHSFLNSSELSTLDEPTAVNDLAAFSLSKECRRAGEQTYTHWPNLATSYAGGNIDYKLTIENKGTLPLTTLEIIDILPHPGDTGVILTNQGRGSLFTIHHILEITAYLIDANGTLILSHLPITIYYSKSFNPIRFGLEGTDIGEVNDWQTTPPDSLTTLGAYKIISDETSIPPGYQLIIITTCALSTNLKPGYTAWNSFAARATYLDMLQMPHLLLPLESQKAGVSIINPAGYATIKGLVFADSAQKGLYNPSYLGINDVGVMLYKVDGDLAHLVTVTLTAPNTLGEAGYFTFSLVEPGIYTLRFVPDFNHYTFAPMRLDSSMGSIALPSTGFTSTITVAPDTIIESILVGLTPSRTLDAISKVNQSAHTTMRNAIYSELLLIMKLEETISLIPRL